MAEATPETLFRMAVERAPGGRNNAGHWLAAQLHANGYGEADAVTVMMQYMAAVGGGKDPYTGSEALSTLKAEYRRPAKAPWSDRQGHQSDVRYLRKAETIRRTFPTAPPVRQEQEPSEESIEAFQKQCQRLQSFAGSPADAYLGSRQISPDIAGSSRCKYSSHFGKIGEAVVFPIAGESGKTVAIAGRAIQGSDKQTFGPRSKGVFYTHGALDADPVAIVEAPICALTLAMAGLPAIALCGTAGFPSWVAKRLALAVSPGQSRTVYVALDNDAAGSAAAQKISEHFALVNIKRILPECKDWNDDLRTYGLEHLASRLYIQGVTDWLTLTKCTAGTTHEGIPFEPAELACPVCGKDRWMYNLRGGGIYCAGCSPDPESIGVTIADIRPAGCEEVVTMLAEYATLREAAATDAGSSLFQDLDPGDPEKYLWGGQSVHP